MPTAEANIQTTRAERYLAQLCDHLGHMRHSSIMAHHPDQGGPLDRPAVQQVEHEGRYGEIVFDWGTCKLTALDDALLIRVDAAGDEDLRRAQAMIGHRIETIGQREHFTVIWQ